MNVSNSQHYEVLGLMRLLGLARIEICMYVYII